MSTYSLDQLREDAARKFADMEIEVPGGKPIVLANMLRLKSDDRKKMADILQELDSQNEDAESAVELIRSALALAAGPRGGELLEAIGDDGALLMVVFEAWGSGTQVGEA